MKRLFYLSGTLFFLSLTLLVGFQLGERSALASIDPTRSTIVGVDARDYIAYDPQGRGWSINPNTPFARRATWDLPVPVSDIVFMDDNCLVTTTDEVFTHSDPGWTSVGTFPTPVEPTTWGQVKKKYGK